MSIKKESALHKHRKIILIIATITFLVYVIGLLNPITGPMLRYPYYVANCGKKPVIANTFMGALYYRTPDSKNYQSPGMYDELFCTEEQAQSQGFTKRPETY